ncbi:hypothetical protein [Streptomyces sp. NPDC085596]|uniref:hypothetical protein n=1 Tax=Streptomyces sp. NPDC085596 TaxID=3365731 RepID=UPI0037D6ADF5
MTRPVRVGLIRRMRGERGSGIGRLVARARARRHRAGGTVSPQASMTDLYRTRTRTTANVTPKVNQYQAGRHHRRRPTAAATSTKETA